MLKELVDVLLPGDGRFPPASDAGTHGVVADRLVAQTGRGRARRSRAGWSKPAAGPSGR